MIIECDFHPSWQQVPGRLIDSFIEGERSTATVPFFMPATLRATLTECDRLLETPVTVTIDDVGFAELAAAGVIVLPPAVPAVLNVAVTPSGSPDAVMLTLPVNPFLGNTLIAVAPLCPRVNERLEAEVETRKSLAPVAGEGSTS